MSKFFYAGLLTILLFPIAWVAVNSADMLLALSHEYPWTVGIACGLAGINATASLWLMRILARRAPAIFGNVIVRWGSAVLAGIVLMLEGHAYLTATNSTPLFLDEWLLIADLPAFFATYIANRIVSWLVAPVAPAPIARTRQPRK